MSTMSVERHNVQLSRHRLTVEDFHKIGTAGILSEGSRVELIEGELIDMAPIGSQHAGTVEQLRHWIERAVKESALVFSQNPITLGEHNEPQPDIMVLKPRADFYKTAHPTPRDVLLVVEVADSSAHYDRSVKVPLYAAHAILEVWLVDLQQPCLEIYRKPQPHYRSYQHVDYYRDGTVSPTFLPDMVIDVTALWQTG